MTGAAAPQAVLVTLERETATPTSTVLETWCVEPTTAVEEHTQLWTVVWLQLMKIAILLTMTRAAAPQAVLVTLEVETATPTISVLEAWCVEPTTAVEEHIQLWTIARLLPFSFSCASHFSFMFDLFKLFKFNAFFSLFEIKINFFTHLSH